MSDATTPVLVGVGQLSQRLPEYTPEAKEPVDLMIEGLRIAAEDAGAPALLTEATSVRVIRGIWPYKNPAAYIAEQLGTEIADGEGRRFWTQALNDILAKGEQVF